MGSDGAMEDGQISASSNRQLKTMIKFQSNMSPSSGFAVLGGLCSWFLIPDMSRELETEDARFKAYLEENGYDISHYGEALVERRD
ncbi:hypothetical protein GB937_005851 [Aspergillus fischeri]|nr:hypothetical protein GB937_005851 [Aspergillus fischeri]